MKVEMAADFVDNNNSRRVAAKSGGGGQVQGQEPEQLPCPRCDSINTKFCYYNNYNFSQPRHFCKACLRYWTEGGTLRDIPIGGGDLKGTNNGNVGLCGSGGLGLGSNFVGDAGLSGLGRGVWGFAGMGGGGVAGGGVGSNSSGSGGDGATGIGNTWQFESGEAIITTGFVSGDCFSWPDLATSTPRNGLEV